MHVSMEVAYVHYDKTMKTLQGITYTYNKVKGSNLEQSGQKQCQPQATSIISCLYCLHEGGAQKWQVRLNNLQQKLQALFQITTLTLQSMCTSCFYVHTYVCYMYANTLFSCTLNSVPNNSSILTRDIRTYVHCLAFPPSAMYICTLYPSTNRVHHKMEERLDDMLN